MTYFRFNTEKKKPTKRDSIANLQIADVLIPNALVKTLFSATSKPVIIPAPGKEKMILVLHANVELVGDSTTDFDTDGDLTLNYKIAGNGAAVTGSLNDVINDGTYQSVSIFSTITECENVTYANIVNQPVVLVQDTADSTLGTMDLRVRALYVVLPCRSGL